MLDQARGLYGTGRLEEAEAALVTAISLVSGCVVVGASAPLSLEPAAALPACDGIPVGRSQSAANSIPCAH